MNTRIIWLGASQMSSCRNLIFICVLPFSSPNRPCNLFCNKSLCSNNIISAANLQQVTRISKQTLFLSFMPPVSRLCESVFFVFSKSAPFS
mmetsp:Transcript_48084/g.100535  ORF Transcript_48084/g.100535 Transcript_48084/m.100535 type:complete len:91 (-) Transcript_48084:673-945(-)